MSAALSCYEQQGILSTTMDDIATSAGVGRATLYRHFSNRDEVLTQVVIKDLEELQQLLQTRIKKQPNAQEYFVEGVLLILRETPKRAMSVILFGEHSAALTSRLTLSQDAFKELGEQMLTPFYRYAQVNNQLRPGVTLALMVEWVTRVVVSFVTNPSRILKTEKQLRAFLYPALVSPLLK
ncbi:TetR/AcrR family transcriptional regulator [Sinobacterium norvegicum]|nr:TetR/AcrR family transcriptional regulator [Sinobacterium norvegicum]